MNMQCSALDNRRMHKGAVLAGFLEEVTFSQALKKGKYLSSL